MGRTKLLRTIVTLTSTLACVAAGAPVAVLAQPPIRLHVGDSTFNGLRVRPFLGRWRTWEISASGDTTAGPLYVDEGRITELDGRQVYVQVQHTADSTDGLLAITEHRSFRPIVSESYDRRDGSFVRTEYGHGQVRVRCSGAPCPRGLAATAGDTARKEFAVAEPVFDFWQGSYGLLLAGLPLRLGYWAELPLFHPVQGLVWIRVEVTGQERVAIGDGAEELAWVVRLPQTPFTFYISERAPYWVKLVSARQNGTKQILERYEE